MDGYNVEELYYLYRQNNPIAKALLIKYCYWKAELMLPMYYFYNGIFYNEREDCIQEIVILVFRNLDGYRPDKGGLVKSYMSLIMHRAISTIIVNEKKKHLSYLLLPFIFVSLHISYGIGTIIGLLKMPFWRKKLKTSENFWESLEK